MNMDMDMDVAWCLTCSKRTRDPRSPYCSDECRRADDLPKASSSTVPFTSPVPLGLYTSPAKSSTRRDSISPSKSNPARPAPAPPPLSAPSPLRPTLRPMPTVSGTVRPEPRPAAITEGTRRDRRAFSFPSQPSSDPLPFARRARQSTVLTPSAKRSIMSGLTPIMQPIDDLPEAETGARQGALLRPPRGARNGQGRSTGGNTPLFAESVFLSTSDSSDDGLAIVTGSRAAADAAHGADTPPALLLTPSPTLQPPSHPSTLPERTGSAMAAAAQFSTLRSQLSSGRANLHSREASQSPVAALVASSASSRSREDIISWAKAVDMRPRGVGESDGRDEDAEDRGRSRTRHKRLSSLPAHAAERLDETHEESEGEPDMNMGHASEQHHVEVDASGSGLGTTPKGRIGSALAGLSMSGVGSMIKALTAVTGAGAVTGTTTAASTPVRGVKTSTGDTPEAPSLTSMPSAASVSRVAVFAHTSPALPLEEAQVFLGGTTPTLSTVSISEVVDPSVQGTHDLVDIYTDDGGMSAASSSNFIRRVSMAGQTKAQLRKQSQAQTQTTPASGNTPLPVPERQQRTPNTFRPITTTASALWNMTSYLARFAPFSLSAAVAPYAPFAAEASSATPGKASSRAGGSGIATPGTPVGRCAPTSTPLGVQPIAAAAGPRSRPDSPEHGGAGIDPEHEMVRSLPMAILQPPCSTDEDWERERQRQNDLAARSRMRSSRSRARSKSRSRRVRQSLSTSRSRSRSRSRDRQRAGSPRGAGKLGLGRGVMSPEMPVGSSNQDVDADADVSEAEEEERGRGRGRARARAPDAGLAGAARGREGGKVVGMDDGLVARASAAVERGLETAVTADMERGRGRSRSVKPNGRVVA